jgi:hypothetical protein
MKVTISGRNTNYPLTKDGGLLNQTKGLECGFRSFRCEARTLMTASLKCEFEEVPKIKGRSGLKGNIVSPKKLRNAIPDRTVRRTFCLK